MIEGNRFNELEDAAFGRVQALQQEALQVLNDSQLPAPVTGSTIVVYVNGVAQAGTIGGTTNEITVTQAGAVLTIAFADTFILKGANTPLAARTALGLGTAATQNQAAASADTAPSQSGAYVQVDVQAILTELRDLKTKLRTAGLLAT